MGNLISDHRKQFAVQHIVECGIFNHYPVAVPGEFDKDLTLFACIALMSGPGSFFEEVRIDDSNSDRQTALLLEFGTRRGDPVTDEQIDKIGAYAEAVIGRRPDTLAVIYDILCEAHTRWCAQKN